MENLQQLGSDQLINGTCKVCKNGTTLDVANIDVQRGKTSHPLLLILFD